MSVTLWALVTLQLNTFAVDPGYESKSECEAMYKGQHTLCFPYDPDLKTWSMFQASFRRHQDRSRLYEPR